MPFFVIYFPPASFDCANISLTSPLFRFLWHVVLVEACIFPATNISPHKFFCIFGVFMLLLILATVTYSTHQQKGEQQKENKIPPPPLWKERAGKEGGGMRQRGRVSTTRQSYVWHPCSQKEGRTDTKPVRPSRRERGEGGREGRGNKCKKTGGEKRGDKDAQGLHQFLSARNKKHCFREWQLVSWDTRRVWWETRQISVAGAAEHQSSVCVCLSLPARTEPWHDFRVQGFWLGF